MECTCRSIHCEARCEIQSMLMGFLGVLAVAVLLLVLKISSEALREYLHYLLFCSECRHYMKETAIMHMHGRQFS